MNRPQTSERWTIEVRSDIVVLRTDPEYAELGNPRGEILGECFYLTAANAYGDRRAWGSFEDPDQAEAAIETAPAVEEWADTYPVYGSPAYEDYGAAEEIALERKGEL